MTRRHALLECEPRWITAYGEEEHAASYLQFKCPEGHHNCWHTIPFTPALDGRVVHGGRTHWLRSGRASFDDLTLAPSIRRRPAYASEEDAVRWGCTKPVAKSLLCALHIHITNGKISFCSDSR